ncbi:hypothetical protein Nmel_002940 [Mimus melanotis]
MHGASASTTAAVAQSSLGQHLCSLFQSCSLPDDDEPLPFERKGLATSSQLRPASSKQRKLWTLPPCQVTVCPKDHYSFWEAVKVKALKQGDWDLLEQLGMPQGGIRRVEEGVQVDPVELSPASEGTGGPQVFPVFKVVLGSGQADRHDVIAWRVVQDLQDKVEKYGLGSPQVVQIIRVLNTDLLAPYDIRHLAQVLFQPVQFKLFEENWRQMADKTANENMHQPQMDLRIAAGTDALMDRHRFSSPDMQATWDPLILEQCQKIGLATMLKTMEAAAQNRDM